MCLKGYGGPITVETRRSVELLDLVLLRRARDRIDREYAQPLDVAALARGVNMPVGQFSREFMRAYGQSPYSYLTSRRTERRVTPKQPPSVRGPGR